MSIDCDLWQLALVSHEELFVILYDWLQKGLLFILEPILSNLWGFPERWELAPECT
jgi:phosphoenolpyruvate carboxykinase (GTP)